MNFRKTLGYVAVVGLWCVLFLTIGYAIRHPAESPRPESTPLATALETAPIDEGEDVYVFYATGDTYIRSLVKFYKLFPGRHCDLQGFTDGTSYPRNKLMTRTVVTGFILHCHDIATDAQTITIH